MTFENSNQKIDILPSKDIDVNMKPENMSFAQKLKFYESLSNGIKIEPAQIIEKEQLNIIEDQERIGTETMVEYSKKDSNLEAYNVCK